MVRTEHTRAETAVNAYGLREQAEKAVACLTTIEGLTRRIRTAFEPIGKDGEKGIAEAEKRLVEAHSLVWKEIVVRWGMEVAEADVSMEETPSTTDPFNW